MTILYYTILYYIRSYHTIPDHVIYAYDPDQKPKPGDATAILILLFPLHAEGVQRHPPLPFRCKVRGRNGLNIGLPEGCPTRQTMLPPMLLWPTRGPRDTPCRPHEAGIGMSQI